MSSLADIRTPLCPGQFFHVYNRGNGGQLIFYKEENYLFFLEKIKKYMSAYWDVYAYCLLPNHFHLMVKIKPAADLIKVGKVEFKRINANFLNKFGPTDWADQSPGLLHFKNLINLNKDNYHNFFSKNKPSEFKVKLIQWMVSEKLRRFFLSYAKAINKQEGKTGSLFQKLFWRKHVSEFEYLYNLVLYIHRNPVHHGKALAFKDWRWSSFFSFLSNQQTALRRDEIIAWFKGKDNFLKMHESNLDNWIYGQKYIIEE